MPRIRDLGCIAYQESWQQMLDFSNQRNADTEDELWLLEHPPVFTQGKAGKAEHVFHTHEIPLVQSDRGGQVTYHGPGQLVCYVLVDLHRLGKGIKSLVGLLETALIETLQHFQITANVKPGAPGVYVDDNKIASLGLRVRNGCTLHGLSLNVAMDLQPFSYIRPCGLSNIGVTQISAFEPQIEMAAVKATLGKALLQKLG